MTRFETFDAIELAVLCEVMQYPARALPLVPQLEVDDFSMPARRHAFEAVRNLEAAGKAITLDTIADCVFAGYQLAHDGTCTVCDECAVIVGIGAMFVEAERYVDDDEAARLLPRHARQLRTIRYGREAYYGVPV